jgi:Flp pilus assembly protein TadB
VFLGTAARTQTSFQYLALNHVVMVTDMKNKSHTTTISRYNSTCARIVLLSQHFHIHILCIFASCFIVVVVIVVVIVVIVIVVVVVVVVVLISEFSPK